MPDAAARLILIGYWAGPDTTGSWPAAKDFVDPTWDEDERSLIVDYLRRGHVLWGFMGWSRCRLCGRRNGDLELTDGTYLWPDGLVHYVEDHAVRLPAVFGEHVTTWLEGLEEAGRDVDWWSSARPVEPAPADSTTPPALVPVPPHVTVIQAADDEGALAGRERVLEVVDGLRRELADGSAESWENDTLERFLEAFGELLAVVERTDASFGRPGPLDPWDLVAETFRGARFYE